MPATVSKPIPRLFSLILTFFAGKPLHVDVIVNASLSRFFSSIWPPVAVNILLVSISRNRRFGGGAIVETLPPRRVSLEAQQ